MDISAAFKLPPEEAIAFLESKGYRVTFDWHEMLDEAHALAFTVAKAARLDILSDIRGALVAAMEQGKPFDDFLADLAPTLKSKGWWGKDVVIDPDTLDAQLVQLGSNRRLKTIYETNLQSAYMAARCKAQMAANAFPYLMYVAVMDSRTRPTHAALHGRVFRKDDPIWRTHYPPNGYNCRCRTRALTEGQVAREGLAVESSAGRILTKEVNAGVNKVTGEISKTTVTGITVIDHVTGKESVMWVDAGFDSSPCNGSPIMDDLLYKKARQALLDDQAMAAVAEVLTSDVRLKVWEAFVMNAIYSGVADSAGNAVAQGRRITAGTASAADLEFLASKGITPDSPLFTIDDRMMVGKKARRHDESGDSLSEVEWNDLPTKLAGASRYWDDANRTLLYVFPSDDGRMIKVAVDFESGEVVTAFKVDPGPSSFSGFDRLE
jgi:SPP1 gp7 family putative phage head morphogenesis protein